MSFQQRPTPAFALFHVQQSGQGPEVKTAKIWILVPKDPSMKIKHKMHFWKVCVFF